MLHVPTGEHVPLALHFAVVAPEVNATWTAWAHWLRSRKGRSPEGQEGTTMLPSVPGPESAIDFASEGGASRAASPPQPDASGLPVLASSPLLASDP
jgi:hypothetical protein